MEDNLLSTARILIVDDQPANVILLEAILDDAEFISYKSVLDSRQTLPTFIDYLPDLVLLDLQMPYLDGFAVLKQLQACLSADDFLPVLVLTADITSEAKRRALSEGAMDFLTKPFDATEVILRIKNLLRTRFLHLQLHGQNRLLDQKVRERTVELEATQIEILERLALAAEYRDDATGEHTKRVGETAARIAQALGWSSSDAELIRRAAPLHDVGKIAIPDAILLKPGKLTPAEFDVMKTHAAIGAGILSGGRFPLLQLAEQIALTHHERWDGTGYIGLQGEAIPLPGRIVSIVDVFDALTSERPYKKAWSLNDTIAEIRKQKGRQFDPELVDVLLEVIDWQPVV